jgi:hypothetical protein
LEQHITDEETLQSSIVQLEKLLMVFSIGLYVFFNIWLPTAERPFEESLTGFAQHVN